MATTFTLTGTFKHPDGVTPIVGSGVHVKAAPYPDTSLKVLLTAGLKAATDANGSFSMTLESRTGLYYTIKSLANTPLFTPIQFLAPAAGTTVDITALTSYDPTGSTPNVYTDTVAARNAAIAAAAGVQTNNWAATTAYVIGQIVRAPDGSTIASNSSRTSRASFDATEQGFWTVVAVKSGTLEQVALAKTYSRSLNVKAYGATGDGSTDDTTAIQSWLTALAALPIGGCGYMPAGTYKTTQQLIVPPQVIITGDGLGTVVQAATGFPAATALIALGPIVSGLATGTAIRDLVVDCNSIATQGVYSRAIQENSGLFGVTVKNYTDKGIYIKIPAQNFSIEDCFVLSAATATASWGVNIESVTWFRLARVTVDTNGSTKQTQPGLALNGSSGAITQLHVESQDAGVLIYNGGGGFIGDISGSDITKLVQIGSDAGDRFSLHNLYPGTGGTGTTTTLLDQRSGLSIAGTSSLSSYQGGRAYFAPSDTAGIQARPTVTTARGFVFRGLASQTGEAFRVEDSGGSRLVNINGSDGLITWGSGADVTFGRKAAGVVGTGAAHTIRTGVDTTANRPSASTVGRGSQFYDQTLNKPIWSDGTNWRDGAGTVV